MKPMLMTTERLLIRPLKESDCAALHECLSDPEVMRYVEPPFTRERTLFFIRSAGLCEPPLVHAVIERRSGLLIGHLIWHAFDRAAMELGWILRRDRWGRGYASELTAAMLRAFNGEIVLECSPQNAAVCHIAQKFAFHYAGTADGCVQYRYWNASNAQNLFP